MRLVRWAALFVIGAVLSLSAPAGAVHESASPTPVRQWPLWHLTTSDEFRLPAPPAATSRTTRRELAELRDLQTRRGSAQIRKIHRWNDGPATLPWTEITLQLIRDHRPRPPFAARILAYVHTGMYDALVAARDSRWAHRDARPKPAAADSRIDPVIGSKRGSSYAPDEAAVAGAAETLLTQLFPDRSPAYFRRLADESVESRLWAGANYRSDVERARLLGRRVAERAIERTQTDGVKNSGPAYPRPAGEAYWSPTAPTYSSPPFGGPVGTWKPWAMSTPSELRGSIPGPLEYGSAEFLTELKEVMSVQESLTQDQIERAYFWADGPGTATPSGHWNEIAIPLVEDYDLDSAETARLFAALNVSQADAAIAIFEAKFFYWSIRPITAVWRLCDGGTTLCTEGEAASDPTRAPHYGEWLPVLETPSFPSYPSGHAGFSGAAAAVLGHLIPPAADGLDALAEEAAMSRLWGGIHFRSDDTDGLILGREVARLVLERAI